MRQATGMPKWGRTRQTAQPEDLDWVNGMNGETN